MLTRFEMRDYDPVGKPMGELMDVLAQCVSLDNSRFYGPIEHSLRQKVVAEINHRFNMMVSA